MFPLKNLARKELSVTVDCVFCPANETTDKKLLKVTSKE